MNLKDVARLYINYKRVINWGDKPIRSVKTINVQILRGKALCNELNLL